MGLPPQCPPGTSLIQNHGARPPWPRQTWWNNLVGRLQKEDPRALLTLISIDSTIDHWNVIRNVSVGRPCFRTCRKHMNAATASLKQKRTQDKSSEVVASLWMYQCYRTCRIEFAVLNWRIWRSQMNWTIFERLWAGRIKGCQPNPPCKVNGLPEPFALLQFHNPLKMDAAHPLTNLGGFWYE